MPLTAPIPFSPTETLPLLVAAPQIPAVAAPYSPAVAAPKFPAVAAFSSVHSVVVLDFVCLIAALTIPAIPISAPIFIFVDETFVSQFDLLNEPD